MRRRLHASIARMMIKAVLALVVTAACGAVHGSAVDAGGDVAAGRCLPGAPFAAPALVPGVNLNTSAVEFNPQLTPDELGMYFARSPGRIGGTDLYVTTRSDIRADFSNPTVVANVNGAATNEYHPAVTADGLTLYLSTNQDGAIDGSYDVFVATRASRSVDFSRPTVVTALSTAMVERGTYVMPDGHALYFSRYDAQSPEAIYRAELGPTGFSTPHVVEFAGDFGAVALPVVSPDERTIFFTSGHGSADEDIWTATRASASEPFSAPARVNELITVGHSDDAAWISPDGCALYFASDRAGGTAFDLYVARRGS